jgi:hypothetical protein
MSIVENLQLMKTLDDAWNGQDWDTFSKRHSERVVVRWPGQHVPTRGLVAHRNESIEMFKIFPDNLVANDPYKVLFWSRGVDLLNRHIHWHSPWSHERS